MLVGLNLHRDKFQVVQKQTLPFEASENVFIWLTGRRLLLDSLKNLDQRISHIKKEQEKVILLDMNLPISRTFL